MSESWEGVGEALERANREWNVFLMPKAIADMRDEIARSYARDSSQSFEEIIERVVEVCDLDIDRYSDEWHAAKQALGTLFAQRRANRHRHNHKRRYQQGS